MPGVGNGVGVNVREGRPRGQREGEGMGSRRCLHVGRLCGGMGPRIREDNEGGGGLWVRG